MKWVDEYRDDGRVGRLADEIAARVAHRWCLMEICGGQTHAIVKFGLDRLLPPAVTLVHGPGCPVCVTPVDLIDAAISLAGQSRATVCSFGDMLRVPGSDADLLAARARGGDVRIVYSPLDAVGWAANHPEREVIFFAIGFETTAPATAVAVLHARRRGLRNFSLLVAHVLVPPAIEAILSEPDNRVQGFLAAGHVCTVTGLQEYHALAAKYHVPFVVTGFEPVDILRGVLDCVTQLEAGQAFAANAYRRVVAEGGNSRAREMIQTVFEPADRSWRGLGAIPRSGLALRPEFADFDALKRFAVTTAPANEPPVCIAGRVLRGTQRPTECPAFARECTPDRPLGAPMVSSEGACAAYFRYRGADRTTPTRSANTR